MNVFEKLFNKPKIEKEPEDDQSVHKNLNEVTERLEGNEEENNALENEVTPDKE